MVREFKWPLRILDDEAMPLTRAWCLFEALRLSRRGLQSELLVDVTYIYIYIYAHVHVHIGLTNSAKIMIALLLM